MAQRPKPVWAQPPQHLWSIDEIKLGNVISTYSLNDIINQNSSKCSSNTCTFGRIADDPSLVDIVTAHESCSRVHARISFDNNGEYSGFAVGFKDPSMFYKLLKINNLIFFHIIL